MATEHTLMATFDQMGFFAAEVTPTLKDDIEHSITWSKAATRGLIAKHGPGDINLNTDEYYETYLAQLQKAAWNIRDQESKAVSSEGGKIRTTDIIDNLFKGLLPDDQLKAMKGMWDALEKSSSTAVNSFMSFWVQNSNQDYKDTAFNVSPWYMNQNGNLEMVVTFFGYEEKIKAWRRLFVSEHQESLVAQVKVFKAEFFTSTWADVKDTIVSSVQSHEKDVVRKTPLAW